MKINAGLDPEKVAGDWSRAMHFLVAMQQLKISVQPSNPGELLVEFYTTPAQIAQYITVLKKRDEFSGGCGTPSPPSPSQSQ